jgi:hypothetical protein
MKDPVRVTKPFHVGRIRLETLDGIHRERQISPNFLDESDQYVTINVSEHGSFLEGSGQQPVASSQSLAVSR